MNFTRSLARHEHNKEFEHNSFRGKLSDRRTYKNERNVYDNLSAYSRVHKNASNNVELYMKNYKKRYMKKRGLSKLDCYYENKVFDKFNQICDIGKKMKYDEKRSKMFFLKKYGIGLIIFALIPALGLIFPILFGIRRGLPGLLGECPDGHFQNSGGTNTHKTGDVEEDDIKNCSIKWMYEKHELIDNVSYAQMIFSFIMITIFILFIIYVLIKVIKYEKIKAGKGKMNIKEYCRFCKDIF
ncbi:hypothetical protein PVBG_05909 [Plasmodium vivax Brazil I]|uniref:Variable surface protein Vir35 n=1 Tax=Plasmodium vivax (strain Brazil I) TaxID=1033975 RepID=A0A0J9VQ37_PLAV1|nr:hypothetical protein PVBG_05909 [Plasmodium vivax Brazil I]